MAPVSKRDYYETLGVDRNVSEDELKKAYRKLARQHHPDLHVGDQQKKSAEAKFKEINEAYETLSDQDKRKRYDMFGHAGAQQGGPGFDGFDFNRGGFGDVFNDIFEDFFGQARGGGATRAERGNDLQYNLEITFEEAVYGKEAKLKIPRWELCIDCKGTGAKSASAIKPCTSCKGAGQIRFQQGFFSVSRPCGQCDGTGHFVTDPCSTCQGRQRVYKERTIAVHIPAGDGLDADAGALNEAFHRYFVGRAVAVVWPFDRRHRLPIPDTFDTVPSGPQPAPDLATITAGPEASC